MITYEILLNQVRNRSKIQLLSRVSMCRKPLDCGISFRYEFQVPEREATGGIVTARALVSAFTVHAAIQTRHFPAFMKVKVLEVDVILEDHVVNVGWDDARPAVETGAWT